MVSRRLTGRRCGVCVETRLRDLAARCARGVDGSSAQRGRGERRMPNAPAASCALVVVERTRVTTSTPESPDVPARNGFNGFLRALPGDRALLPPSPTDMVLSKPGRADVTSANLTPASGRQDHTTSPYAATSLVRVLLTAHKSFDPPCDPVARKTLPRPPHPLPNVCDDRETPLCGPGRDWI
jgi:hypothetical protein